MIFSSLLLYYYSPFLSSIIHYIKLLVFIQIDFSEKNIYYIKKHKQSNQKGEKVIFPDHCFRI